MMSINKDDNIKYLQEIFGALSSRDILEAELLSKISSMIAAERIAKKMTQKEFAEYLDVSQTMVSKWESSDYNFSIKLLAKVFDKLEKPIDIVLKHSVHKANELPKYNTNKRYVGWRNQQIANDTFHNSNIGGWRHANIYKCI